MLRTLLPRLFPPLPALELALGLAGCGNKPGYTPSFVPSPKTANNAPLFGPPARPVEPQP